MTELRYPIGIQTFSKIMEEGYAYVDKTQYIKPLLKQGQFIFLSRPRRFGKSLFMTTLKAYFQGRKELFYGLAISREESEWLEYPVLHFDFNTGLYSVPEGLKVRLNLSLSDYEKKYGISSDDDSPEGLSVRFETLIKTAYAEHGRRVVILIDEYDKPLLGLEDFRDIYQKNQRLLKSFYGNLKSMDEYIHFGFITGVGRFSKVSIFSDLNNLKDIALDDKFADICGWTESELEATFGSGIEELAETRGERYEDTLVQLRNYYDGYLFSQKGTRLYNPFSVMRALDSQSIDPYWFATGSPSFLVEMVKSQRIDPRGLNGVTCRREQLVEVDMDSRDPVPLMFQTGYLTIAAYDSLRRRYTLRFPNKEVEMAFAYHLLPLYIKEVNNYQNEFGILHFQDDLYDGDPFRFMRRLATLFKTLPYDDHYESAYRAITFLICKVCNVDTVAELQSYKGRSDLDVVTPDYVYIFEFKYNKSVKEAMEQIHSRDYAGRYAMDSREIYLIAANYDCTKDSRGLDYEIVKLTE